MSSTREGGCWEKEAVGELAGPSRSEFLSRLSHELRTPMNAILGFAQLLEQEPMSPEGREDLAQIRKAGQHLLGLINDVLDLSAVDADQMPLSIEAVRLDDAMAEAAARLRPLFESRGIRLEGLASTVGKSVQADRQRLAQVLVNLLTNAANYNRSGGRITLEATPEPGDLICLAISDEGQGISEEKIQRLFTPFDRLGVEETGVEGTGLGLCLSQSLLRAMQGDLAACSVAGEGSTFTLCLPAALPTASSTEPLPGGRRALYVEGDAETAHLIRRILGHRPGLHLSVAPNLVAGLASISNSQPDMLLLDLDLPDGSGESVVRWARTECSLPLIVLSADATPGQAERLVSAGADYYVTKPINMAHFLQVVDHAIPEDAS